jgi:hypothetical protein
VIVDDIVENRENREIQNMALKSRKRSLAPVLAPQTLSSSKLMSNIIHSTTMNINGKEFTYSQCEESIPFHDGTNNSCAVGIPGMVKREIETDIPEISKITNRELLIAQFRKDIETNNQEQDENFGEGKENKVDVVRGKYDRWKESIEKKRKLSEAI